MKTIRDWWMNDGLMSPEVFIASVKVIAVLVLAVTIQSIVFPQDDLSKGRERRAAQQIVQHLKAELNLTSEQTEKVYDIVMTAEEEVRNANSEIRQTLTTDQRRRYDRLLADVLSAVKEQSTSSMGKRRRMED